MEPRRSDESSDPAAEPIGDSVPGGRIDRMVYHTEALADDITDWIDLRIQLLQLEIEEEAERRLNSFIARAIIATLVATAGLFALLTLAFGLGWWLGHPFWGFAIVTGLLVTGAGVVAYARPEFVHRPVKLRSVPSSEQSEQ